VLPTESAAYQTAAYQDEGVGSELEQLVEALPFVQTAEDFAAVVEDSFLEAVKEALALSGDQPRRKQLEAWLEELPPTQTDVEAFTKSNESPSMPINEESLAKGNEQPPTPPDVESRLKVGDRVFALNCPHTASMGPFLIEAIEGALAKLEMFCSLIPLAELEIVS
jgi:hypothetical protein